MKEDQIKSSESEFFKIRIHEEQKQLRDFFIRYLPSNFKPDSIMDFCCGAANEEPVLFDLYGEDVSITSFDNSKQILHRIKELGIERKSIIKLDIDEIDWYFQNKIFDLLLGRNIPINPNYRRFSDEEYPDSWPRRVKSLKKHLTNNGYLLMTFATKDEFERALEILDELNYCISIREKNRISIPSDYIGIVGAEVKDNYVILSKK